MLERQDPEVLGLMLRYVDTRRTAQDQRHDDILRGLAGRGARRRG